MLNIDTLKDMLKVPFEDYLNSALYHGIKAVFPVQTVKSDEMSHEFADTITAICAEPIADALAGAIDYYVRSISISGTIITTGSPASQTAIINSPQAATNGVVPNSLGIN